MQRRRILQSIVAFVCWCALSHEAAAQSLGPGDVSTLMVVLRESQGANKQDDALKPTPKFRATMSDGKQVEMEMAWYEFIGDMHIRFVFDDVQTMRSLRPEELADLNLQAEKALEVAVSNIKRVYGEPEQSPLDGGIFQVQGKSPDLDSSYFLDKDLWRRLLKQYPDGLVVAVPHRGGLLFAPVTDSDAVELMQDSVDEWYRQADRLRVSSALYLFKDDHWSVYQAPLTQ